MNRIFDVVPDTPFGSDDTGLIILGSFCALLLLLIIGVIIYAVIKSKHNKK